MGVISRKLFPVCESMCVCCPAFRASSRQPVKRYKKLLAEIFPKSSDGNLNERKITKLCEYASKNPVRLPKIAKHLEERCYKELRCGNTKLVNIVAEACNKLLGMCKEQMAYFSSNVLNVIVELLDDSKQEALMIIGCNTLTTFILCQVDCTYARIIESFITKTCMLAKRSGDVDHKRQLRASSLKCLSAMIWYMTEFTHLFSDFEKIVNATLDNYGIESHSMEDGERRQVNHNWVDEVERCEGRRTLSGAGVFTSPNLIIARSQPERKDPSLLTREEADNPQIWAQICVQRMVDMSRETTTMRRVLEPMFSYFDKDGHWVPQNGLASIVLSDMMSFMGKPGHHQLILGGIIRHLDNKNVMHDPQLKCYIVQTATCLACQIRAETVISSDMGFISDLFWHMRKTFQVTSESVGEEELNLNAALQNSIETCLLETVKGAADVRPLFDMMAISLEKLSPVRLVARATVASLVILSHVISLVSLKSHSPQVFPEALFIQILKVMMHPDADMRVGGHQIFCALLIPVLAYERNDAPDQPRRWHSKNASTSSSISALLEKLRMELHGAKEKHGSEKDDHQLMNRAEEDPKIGKSYKNSPNIHIISSIVERTTGVGCFSENDQYFLCCTEDQMLQLLSTLWVQLNSLDNQPINIEAVSHTFCLAVIHSHLKISSDNLAIKFVQLPLSLRRIALQPNAVPLAPAYQLSLHVLSTSMLIFAAKLHHGVDANHLHNVLLGLDVDPHIGITDDFQVYLKPQSNIGDYHSYSNEETFATLADLREKSCQSDQTIHTILAEILSTATKLEVEDVVNQLSEGFVPDDAFIFEPQLLLNFDHTQVAAQSKESQSFDGDVSANFLVEDDAVSASSIADVSCLDPRVPPLPSPLISNIVSISQLLESALEVASQVAGASVSTSPLPYSALTNQCEAFGTDTRKKLSNWLASGYDSHSAKTASALSAIDKITCGGTEHVVLVPSLRLPPASPFDNFLKAARG